MGNGLGVDLESIKSQVADIVACTMVIDIVRNIGLTSKLSSFFLGLEPLCE